MGIINNFSSESLIEVIGHANGKKFWTNQCLAAVPTNAQLHAMTDKQLKNAAYGDPKHNDMVRQETYRAPSSSKEAEAQGHRPNEEYYGICRAMIHLKFREARRIESYEQSLAVN